MLRLPINAFPYGAPPPPFRDLGAVYDWARRMWDGLIQVRHGKFDVNVPVEFDSASPTTTTVFTDPRLTVQSQVIISPINATAVPLYENGIYAFEADRTDGVWTFTHTSSITTGMRFLFTIIG